MTYPRDASKLSNLVQQAMNRDEVKGDLVKAGLSDKFILLSKLKNNWATMWEFAAKEISEFERLEKILEGTEKSTIRKKPKIIQGWKIIIQGFSILGLSMMILYVGGFCFKPTWFVVYRKFVGSKEFLLIVMPLIAGIFLFCWVRLQLLKYQWHREQKELALRITQIKSDIERVSNEIDEALLQKGILPWLREIINLQLKASYSTNFGISSAIGLSEVFDPSYEINTEAKTRLNFMLNNMAGGSIGIAGPRGAGKTTLLQSFCGEYISEANGKKVLPVITSAPVKYEAREFILHIFASTCRSLLNAEGVKAEIDRDRHMIKLPHQVDDKILFYIAPVTKLCILLGILLCALSLILALLMPQTADLSASDILFRSEPNNVAVSDHVVNTAQTSKKIGRKDSIVAFIRIFEVKPGDVLKFGVCFVTAGLGGVALLRQFYEREKYLWHRLAKDEDIASPVKEANRWLKEIKFQQTYTSGWSGSMKLPIGIEGGINTAISLAGKQMSLPEIVDGFVRFLKLISHGYKIIIGIDELDKLDSDEKAQRFLNEIKAIFGLPNCFYLISVSESAMSNFEQRGLPFRDTFDSSFDNVIYVDYLNLEKTKRLIARRVIGMPVPFSCLCYCVSGGLARDAIRACRNLIECAETGLKEQRISKLCRCLLLSDIQSKILATATSVRNFRSAPHGSFFLGELYNLQTSIEHKTDIRESCVNFLKDYQRKFNTIPGSNKEVAEHDSIKSLHKGFAAYLYYCITIIDFFDKNLNTSTLKDAEDKGAFDKLARVRQCLSIEPAIAIDIIDTFRSMYKMEIIMIG